MTGAVFGGIRNCFAQAKGYVKGALTSLAENIIPLALSAGTLITSGPVSKACAAATGLYGAVRGTAVAFGIGKSNPLNK